jgi:outer membrane lipoprotein-sorting protein
MSELKKTCPHCGKTLPDDALFCPACGKETAGVCPACGAKLVEGADFCHRCGKPLAKPSPDQPLVCKKCGKENFKASKFCRHCGELLETGPVTPLNKEPAQPVLSRNPVVGGQNETRLRSQMNAGRRAAIIFAGIAVVLFILYATGISERLIGGGGAATTTTHATSTTATTHTTTTTAHPTTTTTTITSTMSTTTTTHNPTTTSSLSDVFAPSANIKSMKYDMLISGQGVSMTGTIWWEADKMRMEQTTQGMASITFIDGISKTMTVYMPAQNMAVKAPYDSAQMSQSPVEQSNSIANSNGRVTGTATVDGKLCSVVEYTGTEGSVKVWVWKDKGIPLRIETTASSGKTTVEYKNFDFSDIPDSMFVLPAGIPVM